ncbi:unnamed protein product, partial [Vitis vinifera]
MHGHTRRFHQATCSSKLSKVQALEAVDYGDADPGGTIALYGRWRMEPLCLPCAVNGIGSCQRMSRVKWMYGRKSHWVSGRKGYFRRQHIKGTCFIHSLETNFFSKTLVWALIISHFCHNWGIFILLTWMRYMRSLKPRSVQACWILLYPTGKRSSLCSFPLPPNGIDPKLGSVIFYLEDMEEATNQTLEALEALVSKIFMNISSLKSAYIQLQVAHTPYEPDKIQAADSFHICRCNHHLPPHPRLPSMPAFQHQHSSQMGSTGDHEIHVVEADAKDYREPPPALLFEPGELHSRPFWRVGIAECMATFLFLYVIISAIIGVMLGGGINAVASGYPKLAGLGAEIVGTVILVYPVLSATDAKSNVRDSHVSNLAPLSIEFAVLLVHPATIPITGTGINPARSLGPPSSTTREMPGMICGFPWLDPSLELL